MSQEETPNVEHNDDSLDSIVERVSQLERLDVPAVQDMEGSMRTLWGKLRLHALLYKIATGEITNSKFDVDINALRYSAERNLKAIREAQRLATTDALTGLPNRAAIDQALEFGTNYIDISEGPLLDAPAVALLDVNRFKKLNDTAGHKKGDDVLRYIGEALNVFNLVDRRDMAGRLGGDEFLVYLDRINVVEDRSIAAGLAYNLTNYVKQRYKMDHGTIPDVSVSVGLSIYGLDAFSLAELKDHADKAMYEAKRAPELTEKGPVHSHVWMPMFENRYTNRNDRRGRVDAPETPALIKAPAGVKPVQ